MADSRNGAFAVILAYKLAASRGLLPGAAVFLSENHTALQAAALYFIMPFGVSLPFFVFWSEYERIKAACLILAFVTAYTLPPISFIGIINPLMASGIIFRGWGFLGILTLLILYAFCSVSRKIVYIFLFIIALFTLLPNDWYECPLPNGIMAVDTSFSKFGSGSFNFSRDFERANMVFGELRKCGIVKTDANTIVLPEIIAEGLTTQDWNCGAWKFKNYCPAKP